MKDTKMRYTDELTVDNYQTRVWKWRKDYARLTASIRNHRHVVRGKVYPAFVGFVANPAAGANMVSEDGNMYGQHVQLYLRRAANELMRERMEMKDFYRENTTRA